MSLPIPQHPDSDPRSSIPFLNAYKDGHLVDSFRLDSGDVFVLGRHVNCSVFLTHPSISRHHLEIRLLHATRQFLLTDLDSVHGTWLDGKQLPSLTPVTAAEGEAIRLGASSRTYKVQWLDLSRCQKVETLSESNRDSQISGNGEDNSSIISDSCNEYGVISQDPTRLPQMGPEFNAGETQSVSSARRSAIDGNTKSERNQKEQQPSRKPLPPVTRRVPFAPLQPNAASPPAQHITKKPPGIEKKVDFSQKQDVIADENQISGFNQIIRRCNSAPPPLANAVFSSQNVANDRRTHQSPAKTDNKHSSFSSKMHKERSTQMGSGAVKLDEVSCGVRPSDDADLKRNSSAACGMDIGLISLSEEDDVDEEYPSDKENQDPVSHDGKVPSACLLSNRGATRGPQGCENNTNSVINRIPFQPLSLASAAAYTSFSPSESYTPMSSEEEGAFQKPNRRPSSVIQNLDCILQKLRGLARLQTHHKWHLVVDSTCLIDPASFKCLKLLEGLAEVRLIVPQIVIRELDHCKRKDRASVPAHVVLKWIESCMMKFPSWIHVQSSSETLTTTPPVSPRHIHMQPATSASYGSSFGDIMSPTNGDHVLNCALLFSTTVCEGQLALLTSDTALKIKAMAEGLICESAVTFCNSLLSPYSDRFLWMGSIAHRRNGAEKLQHRATAATESSSFLSEALSMQEPCERRYLGLRSRHQHHQIAQRLKRHYWEARGLKAILI